jgi:ABC-2 type transport system permease protein
MGKDNQTQLQLRRGLRYEMSVAWRLSIKQWKIELSYPLSVLYFIVSPFLWLLPLLLFGFALTGGLTSTSLGQLTYTSDWFVYSVLGYSFVALIDSCLWGSGMALRREQWVGTLESLYSTPVSRFTLILGSSIHNVEHGGLGVLLQLGATALLFGLGLNLAGLLPALLAVLLLVIGLQGVVLFFASVVLIAKRAWMAVELLVSFIKLLTPMSYPIVVLPFYLQVAAQGIPTYQALESYRQFLLLGPFSPSAWFSLGVLLVLDAIIIIVGWLIFRASDHYIRYRASLAKF